MVVWPQRPAGRALFVIVKLDQVDPVLVEISTEVRPWLLLPAPAVTMSCRSPLLLVKRVQPW